MSLHHPTAIIAPGAQIGDDVEIGPYCVIGEGVKLGSKSRLVSHVSIAGDTEIGEESEIYPFASIGHAPQDLKYEGEASRVVIGARVTIRESVTIHRGTKGGLMETRIGDDCFIMACAHVAHDCVLGDHVIIANAVLLGGHCQLEPYAFIGGGALCQQFIHIGTHAFVSGGCGVAGHVPPFAMTFGMPALFTGVNVIGLKRRDFKHEDIHAIRKAYQVYYESEEVADKRLEQISEQVSGKGVSEIVEFIKSCEGGRHNLVSTRAPRRA